ncbi:MAG: xylulose kinase [Sulfobacillus benefaciens]|uniref:Xylulose kinase n=1 Tax=Sulfobacillus benefaciens TaxID=453960 RepID=A0A2T2XEV4_9FIRM|nr:MAG: xylulose kinase [Sulfobacillus benefaciens]
MNWVMGIDIGTTAVKALILDVESGRYMASSSDEYPLYSEHAGWAEASPDDWVKGMNQAVGRLSSSYPKEIQKVNAISVCGMVPAVVLLDENNRPVRRSIQQSDGRTGKEIQELSKVIDVDTLFRKTGSSLNQQHVLPKLLWVKKHEPNNWQRIRRIVGSYDYIRGLLTGQFAVESNWAVESGCFDILAQTWMEEYLQTFGVSTEWFGSTGESLDVAGYLDSRIAEKWSMQPEIPVMYGSADHVASALAAGVEEPGDLLIKFGGAGDILYCTDEPVFHPQLYFDKHDLPGKYLINGCMAASGSLVRWFLDRIKAHDSLLPQLDQEASKIPPGSDGIVILPYFLGEKTPILNPAARGIVFGLMLHHTDAHLFRAVLESVIYGFRHHVDVITGAGFPINRVFATNGGARSALWRQIAADMLQIPILAFPHHPGSAMGAAIVAAMGTGKFPQRAVLDVIETERVWHEPNPETKDVYDRGYFKYRALYDRTQDLLD